MLIANMASLLSSPSSLSLMPMPVSASNSNGNHNINDNSSSENDHHDKNKDKDMTKNDYHTLRFDFTGNGHSSGEFTFFPHQNDFEDLKNVYKFVTDVLGCRVCCVVGHSQGSCAILKHAVMMDSSSSSGGGGTGSSSSSSNKGVDINQNVSTKLEMTRSDEDDHVEKRCCKGSSTNLLYVNIAGRYTKPNGFQPTQAFTPNQCRELEQKGRFQFQTWNGGRTFEVTKQSVKDRIAYDLVKEAGVDRITKAQVLTIHGDKDETVSIENAYKFDELIPNHTMKIISGANHNFNGLIHMNTIVSSILDFIAINK